MPSVSALYVVKNEQEYLPFSIQSIYDAVQEIVVVDNGSTDQTVERIREFGKVKLFFSDAASYSDLRNYALSRITGDWILTLDADEVYYNTVTAILPRLVANQAVDAYIVWFYHLMRSFYYVQNESDRDSRYWRIAIIRNVPSLRYEGAVHERLQGLGPRTADSGLFYAHYGYTKPAASILDKFNHYANLEGTPGIYDHIKDPEDLLKDRPIRPFCKEHPEAIRGYIEQKAALMVAQGNELYRKPLCP